MAEALQLKTPENIFTTLKERYRRKLVNFKVILSTFIFVTDLRQSLRPPTSKLHIKQLRC